MAEKKVVIYSTPTWPFCRRAKQPLQEKGIKFIDYDVAQDKEKAREMVKISGQMGVPVILVDGQMVIGFNQQKLDELLAK